MASENASQNPFLSPEEQKETSSAPEPVRAPSPGASPIPPVEPSPSPAPVEPGAPSVVARAPQPPLPEANPLPEKKSRWWLWWGAGLLILLLLLGGGGYWWLSTRKAAATPTAAPTSTETKASSTTTTTTTETPTALPAADNAQYKSENFKLGEIAIGGEAEFLTSESNVTPLEISNIRGEAFTEKNNQGVELVVTWATNRLSLADIAYAKGVGQAGKTVTEDDYSFNHSLIITGLDPASTYIYTIKSKDRFGNETTSEPHAVFTGARNVSLFDLIAGAIGDVFGWAVSK